MRAFAVLLATAVLSATPLEAQRQASGAPWTVSLVPTMNPLPIGSCGAVWLTLKDSTGQDAPRNAAGNRVTLADFDMSVTGASPVAVAGAFNGPNNWSVCGCQGAKAGSSAVVTASYPKKSLPQASRVNGVTITQTASFKLRRRMGVSDPPACAELKAARASAKGASKAGK
ncbi:MAG: hypothetical protein ABIP93_04725 [Gemmatimonadaceae bacterium]